MGKSNRNNSRVVAIIGPQSSGKTSLLESLLYTTGTISKKGSIEAENTFGDRSPESKSFKMSTEQTIAQVVYKDTNFSFIVCPGSVEFKEEMREVLSICDAALVVCEPKEEKLPALTPILKELDHNKIPHLLFVNKIESLEAKARDLLNSLQEFSERPLILKEIPVREDNKVVGYVDLVSEKAYKFHNTNPSSLIEMPAELRVVEEEIRNTMLEKLADFDDHIMEQLLEETQPTTDEINAAFKEDIQKDLIVPVLIGSSLEDNGTRRLLQELYDEVPSPQHTVDRLNIPNQDKPVLKIFKTLHLPHKGKVSIGRVWGGSLKSNLNIGNHSLGNLLTIHGDEFSNESEIFSSEVFAIAKMNDIATGDIISDIKVELFNFESTPSQPLFAKAISVVKSTDEIKLNSSLDKMIEEDSSLSKQYNETTNQHLLWGQGEIHLRHTFEKLKRKFGLEVEIHDPITPYKETIESSTKIQGKHKKQSGGHGQFGDVHIEIEPISRGSGFQFNEIIAGGAIPKNYFSAIENGVQEAIKKGPLGFPVEDLKVTLFDGTYHKVDSSDLAFSSAAILAMKEGLTKCQPLLLEPIFSVDISIPESDLSEAQKLISHHRGTILGFDSEHQYKGWTKIQSQIPQAEMNHFIIELRSLSHGLGYFKQAFDHMAELRGKLQEKVLAKD